MSASLAAPIPRRNHLLGALNIETQKRLLPYLELTQLRRGDVLYRSGENSRHAYFPTTAIVASLAIIENGASTQVCMVGNEGVVGYALFLGGDTTPTQAMVQNSGYAYRLHANRLQEEFDRHGEMQALLLRYTQVVITQIAQTATCNRHHSIEQQLCRMLLQTLDRASENELIITQEVIANMLGVRRESVTEAIGRLKHRGLVECHRGRVNILQREKIEACCCECYGVVRTETHRLLPYVANAWPPMPMGARGRNAIRKKSLYELPRIEYRTSLS